VVAKSFNFSEDSPPVESGGPNPRVITQNCGKRFPVESTRLLFRLPYDKWPCPLSLPSRIPSAVGAAELSPDRKVWERLAELGHELWIGDSAKIRSSELRKQKTDERDARLILELLLANRFPRIWVPSAAERDLRQLLWHRHKLVRLRTMLGNQLHFLAMSQGLCRKKKLFTHKGRHELAGLPLGPWASRRREELLKLLDQVEPSIGGSTGHLLIININCQRQLELSLQS
jgi:Transposase